VIFEHQTPTDHALIGPVPNALIQPRTTRVAYLDGLDTYVPKIALELKLPGEHNRQNARMAIEAAARAGVARPAAAAALADFPGLPHRLQFVAEAIGVRYYDDSKATTPEAAMLALGSFPAGVVHVILGGYDKGSDLRPLAAFAAHHCRGVYTIGKTGDTIADACTAATAPGEPRVFRCGTLAVAMTTITAHLRHGDVVLLSPACASWDQFDNYEQRGEAFAQAVRDSVAQLPMP
jgi:UDP-N-acetylmuramoylalanine--D-glutamate ligase